MIVAEGGSGPSPGVPSPNGMGFVPVPPLPTEGVMPSGGPYPPAGAPHYQPPPVSGYAAPPYGYGAPPAAPAYGYPPPPPGPGYGSNPPPPPGYAYQVRLFFY